MDKVFDFPLGIKFPDLSLFKITEIIEQVDNCPLKNSGVKVIMPIGSGDSGIFLIGEAPGGKEEKLGEPFVGASGKFLNSQLLPSVGLNRENIYLTNIVKCRPPNNRDPNFIEIQAWSKVLLSEIVIKKPKLVVCLGRHSLNFFNSELKISKVHGQIFEQKLYQNLSISILPMYHPAVALYKRTMTDILIKDFQKIKNFL